MTPRQLDRELEDERERQIVAVLALLMFVALIGLGIGLWWGMSVGARDAVAVAQLECGK